QHVRVTDGIEPAAAERQSGAVGRDRPPRAGNPVGGRPLGGDAQPAQRHVHQRHIAAGHARQVEAGPARAGTAPEQAPPRTHPPPPRDLLGLLPRRPPRAAIVAAANGALDLAHDRRLPERVLPGKSLDHGLFVGRARHPRSPSARHHVNAGSGCPTLPYRPEPWRLGRPSPVMTLPEITEAVRIFVREHEAWGPPIVLVLAFGESLVFISLLLPATVILFGIGALIGEAGLAFWPMWAAAVIGAALG